MRSTFMGLETARRGMFTQQSALYVTGHNIANANTPGFSRQRINFEQTSPYPAASMNRPQIPGQMGTGVEAGSVQRIREGFLDLQYRVESNKVGYYSSMSESLTKMEEIMNEPSESGLHATMEKFWNSLQDIASHTENTGARDVAAASGQMVADTLNYYYNSLSRVQQDIGNEIGVKVKEINALVSQIDQLNQQIASVEPNGYLPNDLYDERDLYVDQLSQLVNIKVTNVKPTEYGHAKDIAEGLYKIEIVGEDGKSFAEPAVLLDVTKESGIQPLKPLTIYDADDVSPDNAANPDLELISGPLAKVMVGDIELKGFNFSGELAGLIDSYGYQSEGKTVGYYPEMIQKLNDFTKAFVMEFNEIHKAGYALNGERDINFFEPITGNNAAQEIKVNKEILADSSLIAASSAAGVSADGKVDSGNNDNAHLLALIKTKAFGSFDSKKNSPEDFPKSMTSGNLDTYYSGIIGRLGVDSQSAQKNAKNSLVLADSVDKSRQSVSAVSLDEEMTNMIKFQHAYNAAARNITVVDEMLDKIINGMGVVGR
ncbi:flagellar hook-associated protein FlgK [Bacillus infantis]|uniref:flagellar hook-associated protein FlgK n=1 Tax=Bacillus infantis TaxID=324767 RepID=UPI00101D47FF|nr:flagellar hook-associated protein FlgK [Bacillus infantis]RYI27936.1 flagellar hook-associated protein FlgK [Bacillus infantis]